MTDLREAFGDDGCPCHPGQYCLNNECENCAAGSYSDSGASKCTDCKAGQWSSAGASSCTSCPAGTYTTDGKGCINCVAGTYSSAGASTCSDCAEGTYSSAGASKCTSCPAGTYSDATGATTCTSCPTGTTSAAGAVSATECVLAQGNGITMGSYLTNPHEPVYASCRDGTHASGCATPKWITSDDGDDVNLKGMCGYCRNAMGNKPGGFDPGCNQMTNKSDCNYDWNKIVSVAGDGPIFCDWEDVYPPSDTENPLYVWTPDTPKDSVSDMKASYKCTDNTSGYSVARLPEQYTSSDQLQDMCAVSQINGSQAFGENCEDPVACGSRCGCVNTTISDSDFYDKRYGYNDRDGVGAEMCNLTTQYLQSNEFKEESDTGLNKFSRWTDAGQISKDEEISPNNLDNYDVDCRFAGWSRSTHHCPWATNSKGDKHHVPECRCFIQKKK